MPEIATAILDVAVVNDQLQIDVTPYCADPEAPGVQPRGLAPVAL